MQMQALELAGMRRSLEGRQIRFVPCMLVVIRRAMMRILLASNIHKDPDSERTAKAVITHGSTVLRENVSIACGE
jgi:hypothetical protein